MIDLVFRNTSRVGGLDKPFFQKIIARTISLAGFSGKKIEVSINLVSENAIKKLNKKHRNKDKITDVLSFPIENSVVEKYGTMPLGDIFICVPFAKIESAREKVPLKKKIAQLTVHGLLHLLGYDHEGSAKRAREMFKLENKIAVKIGF